MDRSKLWGQLVGIMIGINYTMHLILDDSVYHPIVDPVMPFDPQYNITENVTVHILFINTARAFISPELLPKIDVSFLYGMFEDSVPSVQKVMLQRRTNPIMQKWDTETVQSKLKVQCHNFVELKRKTERFWRETP